MVNRPYGCSLTLRLSLTQGFCAATILTGNAAHDFHRGVEAALADTVAPLTVIMAQTNSLTHNLHVADASSERKARSGHLWNPPQLSDPRILAHHHELAQKIHQRRACLRCGVNRI